MRAALRLWNARGGEQLHGLRPGLLATQRLLELQHFRHLRTHGHQRVERGHGLLKNHGDIATTHATHFALGQCQQISPVEQGLTAELGFAHQPQQTERSHGLARAGFAHQRQLFPSAHIKAHAMHHLLAAKAHLEVTHGQQRLWILVWLHHAPSFASLACALRGSSASRSASPIKVSSSKVMTSTPKVDSEIHHASMLFLP